MSMIFKVHTSCGKVFEQRLDEMSDRQVSGLIDNNPDHPDTPMLKDELARRTSARAA